MDETEIMTPEEAEALDMVRAAYEKVKEVPNVELMFADVVCNHIGKLPFDEAKASCFAITLQLHKTIYNKLSQ